MVATTAEVERLISAARDGDEQSGAELIEAYRNYLHLIARLEIDRQLQRRLCPSDLVQITVLKAWKNFSQFRGQSEAELMGWMRRILLRSIKTAAEREVQAARRSLNREVSLHEELAQIDDSDYRIDAALVCQASSPSAQAGRRELSAIVADRIAQLPTAYREIIVMRNLQGIGFEEIAAKLGKTPGAVRSMWVRALTKLQDLVGRHD